MLKKQTIEGETLSNDIGSPLKPKKPRLADYFGAIKDEDLLRGLEETSWKIRGSSLQKPRF